MDELKKTTYILIFSHFSIFLVVFSIEDDRTHVFSFFVVVTGFCVGSFKFEFGSFTFFGSFLTFDILRGAIRLAFSHFLFVTGFCVGSFDFEFHFLWIFFDI